MPPQTFPSHLADELDLTQNLHRFGLSLAKRGRRIQPAEGGPDAPGWGTGGLGWIPPG